MIAQPRARDVVFRSLAFGCFYFRILDFETVCPADTI